jgi:hypothetical protein
MTEEDELDRVLSDAFPDDTERADNIYYEAVDNPSLAKEILRTARLPRAKRDLKGAVERAHKRWQRQRQAEDTINQWAGLPLGLRDHALGLIRTDPAFVDSVLRLPTDERSSLQVLARKVDGEALLALGSQECA